MCPVLENVFLQTSHSYKFLGLSAKLRKAIVNFIMSVCPHVINSAPIAVISCNFIFLKLRPLNVYEFLLE
jgi:hypothetical protein